MSTRQIRKIIGTTTLPPVEGNSDEEFEPLYINKNNTSSTYQGLEISSHSESENDINDENGAVNESSPQDKTKKKKKKKKKQRKNKEVLDDIDKAVMEVNSMLGELLPSTSSEPEEKKEDRFKEFFSVLTKNLNYLNEDMRCFGLELPEDGKVKKRSHEGPKCKRPVIVPFQEGAYFTKIGISMCLLRKENGCSYFAYNHNRDYQIMHKNYLVIYRSQGVLPLEMLQNDMNIEGLLALSDYLYQAEEYATANSILKMILSNLQYYSHQLFIMTDLSNRLEYKYAENRIFHITALKFMYMLSNKALHRTALEVAKLLINLDPTDPLAVMLIIDTIAIRAREYQWLIDVHDYWLRLKDIDLFFNLKFTYALAYYHMVKKNKSKDYSIADNLLKEAIIYHPQVAAKILKEICVNPDPEIKNHYIFSSTFQEKYKMADMINMAMNYQVKMVCPKFREPPVLKWFLRNTLAVVQQYDIDETVKDRIEFVSLRRQPLYSKCPISVCRHLLIMQSMTKYIMDWEMSITTRFHPWNPLPPENGINRYNYGVEESTPNRQNGNGNNYRRIMTDFIYSMAPHYNPEEPEQDD